MSVNLAPRSSPSLAAWRVPPSSSARLARVHAQDYPHLLVTAGLHDSQVQYWEPAKWVAKLREHGTGDSLLLLKTKMDAGHGGASGRYDRYHDQALVYAFLLDLAQPGL